MTKLTNAWERDRGRERERKEKGEKEEERREVCVPVWSVEGRGEERRGRVRK